MKNWHNSEPTNQHLSKIPMRPDDKFYLISFKILPLQVHTLIPVPLPLLETPLELLFWNASELCCYMWQKVDCKLSAIYKM